MLKALAELRNFTIASFYQSALNVMGGITAGFLVTLVCRPTGSGALIVGNANAAITAGWQLSVTSVTNNASAPNTTISFTVAEAGAAVAKTVTIEGNVGKTLIIHAAYISGTSVRIYVNGVLLLQSATSGSAYTASSGRMGLGNNAQTPVDPTIPPGFIAFGYVNSAGLTNAEVTENALDIITRGNITDYALPTPNAYKYSAAQANNGTPTVLVNEGTAGVGGDLALQGTAVIVGTPPYFLGTAAKLQS
jgi:hypothetical protein